MLKLLTSLALAASVSTSLPAQTAYVPVNAPYAQNLLVSMKKAHPELQKLGLHAIPPNQQDYVIIANPIASKIGKRSSPADLSVLTFGKPTVKPDDKGKFFDLCLPLSDAAGTLLGITVMEIPYAAAKDADDALAKATVVRDEMQRKIANHDQLFEATDVPLKELQTIPLGAGVKGYFDHFGVDLKHSRLFATAEDSHSVLVLNSVDAALSTEISGIARPHAVLYRDDLDRIYVTDGGDVALKIFDAKTYHQIASVALSKLFGPTV
jgi:hypothetical protein